MEVVRPPVVPAGGKLHGKVLLAPSAQQKQQAPKVVYWLGKNSVQVSCAWCLRLGKKTRYPGESLKKDQTCRDNRKRSSVVGIETFHGDNDLLRSRPTMPPAESTTFSPGPRHCPLLTSVRSSWHYKRYANKVA
eukprot:symbB.v1.2.039686.t1/scaffold6725.1/size15937/2